MEAGSDPVPAVLAHHGIAVALGMRLHGLPDVRNAVSGTGGTNSGVESPLGDLQQTRHLLVDPADRDRGRVVAVVAVHDATEVEAHDVALLQLPPSGGDAVDDLVVDRSAQGRGKPVIPLEGGGHPVAPQVVGGHPVEVGGGHPGLHGAREQVQRLHGDRVGLVELVQLDVRSGNHWVTNGAALNGRAAHRRLKTSSRDPRPETSAARSP